MKKRKGDFFYYAIKYKLSHDKCFCLDVPLNLIQLLSKCNLSTCALREAHFYLLLAICKLRVLGKLVQILLQIPKPVSVQVS